MGEAPVAFVDALDALLRRAGDDQAVLRRPAIPSISRGSSMGRRKLAWHGAAWFGLIPGTYRAAHGAEDLARSAGETARDDDGAALHPARGALEVELEFLEVGVCALVERGRGRSEAEGGEERAEKGEEGGGLHGEG